MVAASRWPAIEDKEPAMLGTVWGVLSMESRRQFAKDSWDALIHASKADKEAAQSLGLLCRGLQVRQQTITNGPSAYAIHQYVRYFDRAIGAGRAAVSLVFLAGCRRVQLDALHENLGYHPAPDTDPPIVSVEMCARAHEELCVRFAREDVTLLFAAVAMYGIEPWKAPMRTVVLGLLAAAGESGTLTGSTEPTSENATLQELDDVASQAVPSLKLPDNLIIDAVIRRFAEYDLEDAAGRSRELVEQFRGLDPSRIASHFHVGFIDALAGHSRSIGGGDVNAARKCWYLAGYLQGYCRGADSQSSLAMLSNVQAELELLGDEVLSCGAMPYVLHLGIRLHDAAGRPSDVARLVAACHPLDGEGIMLGLQSVANLLAAGNLGSAREVHASIPKEGLHELPRSGRRDLLFTYRRYEATIFRLGGRIQEAEDIYQAIWDQATSMIQRSVAVDGFALCAAAIGDVAEIAITERNAVPLGRSSDRIMELLNEFPEVPVGARTLVILALADLLRGAQGEDAARTAQRLRDARDHFGNRGLSPEAFARLLRRFDAYAAMLDLRAGHDARAEGAAQSIVTMLNSDMVECLPPFTICVEALQNAMICGAPSSDLIAGEIVARFGFASVHELPLFEIGRQSPAVAKTIAQYLNDGTSAIAPDRRFDVASRLLRGMLEFKGALDRSSANAVFDAMLRASSAEAETARSLADFVLAHRKSLLKVLSEDEIDERYAGACLRCGDVDEAVQAIVRRANLAFGTSDLPELRRLVSQVDELGAGERVPSPVRRRLTLAAQEALAEKERLASDDVGEVRAGEEPVLEFFASSGGSRPVLDFADDKYSRDKEGGDRFHAALHELPRRFSLGQSSRFEKLVGRTVTVTGKSPVELWEYRAIQLQGGWVRVLFAQVGRRLVALHAFSKHQNHLAEEDCQTADRRLREYLS
jgi:hypothetical protein